jgi:predicted GNAT family N-acyltransferase
MPPSAFTVTAFRADDAAHMAASRHIREVVFCREQGISAADEWDDKDPVSEHYLLMDGNAAVATARVRPYEDGAYKVERMAVLKDRRRSGVGAALMMEIIARRTGQTLVLNAQTAVEAFYRKLGFSRDGAVFAEAGIPHIRMTRRL